MIIYQLNGKSYLSYNFLNEGPISLIISEVCTERPNFLKAECEHSLVRVHAA